MIREEVVKSALKKVYDQRLNWGFMDRFTVDENAEVADALEKQIPKKPRNDEYYKNSARCPNCNSPIETYRIRGGVTYCEECGQAIDWSDEHEDSDKKETR